MTSLYIEGTVAEPSARLAHCPLCGSPPGRRLVLGLIGSG
jgi:hypothetical protein